MRYLGSKRRICKQILPLILRDRRPGQLYVEPFMGGCNSLAEVDNPRFGSDADPYVVALFKAVLDGWEPPETVSEEEYRRAQKDDTLPEHLRAFIGYGCSYGGKWFGGYARNAYDSPTRSTCIESRNSILRQAYKLRGTELVCSDFADLVLPKNECVVYCDPPYAGTTGYSSRRSGWGVEKFWSWCDGIADRGHRVFVSEYAAPRHWTEIWSTNSVAICTDPGSRSVRTERLFTRSS